jgi:hypothetical protein
MSGDCLINLELKYNFFNLTIYGIKYQSAMKKLNFHKKKTSYPRKNLAVEEAMQFHSTPGVPWEEASRWIGERTLRGRYKEAKRGVLKKAERSGKMESYCLVRLANRNTFYTFSPGYM